MSYTPQIENFISTLNSTSTPLSSGGTFQGVGEDVTRWGTASIVVFTPHGQSTNGTLTIETSSDGINYGSHIRDCSDTSIIIPHMWTITDKYFRIKYVNGLITASTFSIQVIFSVNRPIQLAYQIDEEIKNETEAVVTRSVIVGSTDSGFYKNVPVTQEGHIEISIHDPLNPFGSIHTETLTPAFQFDAVYGQNLSKNKFINSLGGSAYTQDSVFIVNTGVNQYAQGVIQSIDRVKYRPGQGVVGRFSALFSTPVANSYAIAGFGHAEDGVYFGYRDISGGTPSFGILYVNRGVREIQTLTLSAASSTNENVQIQLGNSFGVANTTSVAVTNSANLFRTAWEISQGSYTGWDAYASGTTVIFVAGSAGNVSGSFGMTASTASGTFVESRPGSAATETFIPQSTWNGDKLNGAGGASNASGVLLDPSKGNVYQIGIQYLGFGAITFKIETSSVDGNNSTWSTVHTIKNPNILTATSFKNPNFPFTMAAYSAGSTQNVEVKCGSVGAFIEGKIETLSGSRFTYDNTRAAYITNGVYKPFFTIMNALSYNNLSSQVIINLLSIGGSIQDNASNGTLYIIKNGTLVGNPNFSKYSSTSTSLIDTSATSVTFSDNNQILFSVPIGLNSNQFVTFISAIPIQPGEWVTIAGKGDSTTLDYMSVSLNTREDQ